MSKIFYLGFLTNCARCGHDHKNILVSEFKNINPKATYTHYTSCPVTKEPILLYFKNIETNKSSVEKA